MCSSGGYGSDESIYISIFYEGGFLKTFPSNVNIMHQAMANAVRDMRNPSGLRRLKKPAKATSIIYTYGVRFEQDRDDPGSSKQRWYCLATPNYRRRSLQALASGGLSTDASGTGNATRHLRDAHCKFARMYFIARHCACKFLLQRPSHSW